MLPLNCNKMKTHNLENFITEFGNNKTEFEKK